MIQELFCDPPIVIARLGGSTTPLASYTWADPPNPRADSTTVIMPDWSFNVLPDGSLEPFKPDLIRFRDGNLIRPVCPFIEIWARVGDPGSDRSSWKEVPLTLALITGEKADESALLFVIDARNAKAARRRQDANLIFGTFPPVEIRGDQHMAVPLNATSPLFAAQPMIPRDRSLPLGSAQVIRPRSQPAPGAAPWPDSINLEVIRIRFTPAEGLFYGPPQATQPTNESPVPAVAPANAFLNPASGWLGQNGAANPFVMPGDTFDEIAPGSGISLGVVDDTCEARIDVELRIPGTPQRVLRAHANVFVGPPDFGPDRRPFLSLADELNDRTAGAEDRNAAVAGTDLEAWVQDLFERVFETVSLMNVDFWRSARGLMLTGTRLSPTSLPGDGAEPVDQAMGSRDVLRNLDERIDPFTSDTPLPVSEHARERHRTLADIQTLKDFVVQSPDRMKALIRAAFEVEAGETDEATTMRMPPFMRNSNALPLTLSAWQYSLLMRWVEEVKKPPAPTAAAARDVILPLSAAASRRRDAVLRRLG
jgi:hypothetical protein